MKDLIPTLYGMIAGLLTGIVTICTGAFAVGKFFAKNKAKDDLQDDQIEKLQKSHQELGDEIEELGKRVEGHAVWAKSVDGRLGGLDRKLDMLIKFHIEGKS